MSLTTASPSSLTMYTSSIPVFVQSLRNLSTFLDQAVVFAEGKKIDETVLINARLAPDMFPLSRQIQIACDIVKAAGARLAGIDVPSFPDNETTTGELRERIAKTIRFLENLTPDQINGSEQRPIKLKAGPMDLEFTGIGYLSQWVFPNLYFHMTTTYNILRHNGVELGKRNFLGLTE
jgi:uncharacterized protein